MRCEGGRRQHKPSVLALRPSTIQFGPHRLWAGPVHNRGLHVHVLCELDEGSRSTPEAPFSHGARVRNGGWAWYPTQQGRRGVVGKLTQIGRHCANEAYTYTYSCFFEGRGAGTRLSITQTRSCTR